MLPSVMICTPCKDGTVDLNYAMSMMATGQVLTAAGITYTVSTACTSSIDNSRSVLATLFLKSSFTHLLFIDDDMAWASDLPLRLLNENVDIVGVPYRKKKSKIEFTVKHAKQVASIEDRPWMLLVEAIGMGMTLISRKVFERLASSVPEYHCYGPDIYDPQLLFFRHDLVKDSDGRMKYESEDFHFCRLARNIGFDVWAYADEDVPHIGRTAFSGAYGQQISEGIEHGFSAERPRNYARLAGIEK